MGILEVIIELFVSGLGAVPDLMARIGYKLLVGLLAIGVAVLLWYSF